MGSIFLYLKGLRVAKFIIANQSMILIGAGLLLLVFIGGFYYGWKTKTAFTAISNSKEVRENIELRRKQNEISNRNYDSSGFRNDILRGGRL